MKAIKLTTEQIRANDVRNFNSYEWDRIIDRFEQYKDVEYFMAPRDKNYSYDRFFAEYTLPTGLRLFGDVSYSSSMTNGGFYRLDKQRLTTDGKSLHDATTMFMEGDEEGAKLLFAELTDDQASDQWYEIGYGKFTDEATGDQVLIGTSPQARQWMTERCVKYGMAFTKG
jgi:hypothetical protein